MLRHEYDSYKVVYDSYIQGSMIRTYKVVYKWFLLCTHGVYDSYTQVRFVPVSTIRTGFSETQIPTRFNVSGRVLTKFGSFKAHNYVRISRVDCHMKNLVIKEV